MVCQHGGVCVEGSCSCPSGWTGELCQTQMTPTALHIKKIIVNQFPDGNFDSFSSPDIYVAISEGEVIDNNEFTTDYYEDVIEGNSYEFEGTTLTNVSSFYTVSIYDYDELDADDSMSGIIFKPIDNVLNFPPTIVLNNTSIQTSITLEVEWMF